MWLSSWDDAWLLLAVEGKIEHDYVKDAFGANEAKAALHTRRRALLAAAPVALVPNAARKGRAELDEWGGCVHPEQLLSSPNRALKAAFVLHSLEAQCTSSGGERGTVAFAKAMGSLLVLPPAHLERRIVGEVGAAGASLLTKRYEPVTAMHSWDTAARITNTLLFKLQRHADHHAHAGKRYQTLQVDAKSPQLPSGYATCILLAFVPPLWRAVMHPRLMAFRATQRGQVWRHGPQPKPTKAA